MDPLSLSASIIAVLQLTGKLLSYLNDVRNATKEQAQLAVEASNIYSLLVSLRFRVEQSNPHDPWFTAVRGLGTKDGPLDQMKQSLERFESKLKSSKGVKKLRKQIAWSFEKSDMADILARIERIKTLVNIAITNDLFTLSQAMHQELGAVGQEVSEINTGMTALDDGQKGLSEAVSGINSSMTALNLEQQEGERRQIEIWLSSIDFRSRQQEILKGAQEGTRQWLFDSEKFQNWMDADHGTLWCTGIPGAGKTVTSSIIINYLQTKYGKESTAVLCLFCNYRDRAAQTAGNFMTNMLKQVIQQKRAVPRELTNIYKERREDLLTFAESAKLFENEISCFSKVFVLIDALDETSEHEDIRRLLLAELQRHPFNLLVTSRYEKSIEQRLAKAERLEIKATAADVRTYVKARLPSEHLLSRHIQADPTLEERIVTKIIEKSQGMFLMAKFHMDSLVTKTKRKDVRKALETLPPEIDDIYDQTLERIHDQGKDYSDLAKRVLLWVGNTFQPLSPVELQHAVAIQPGMTRLEDEDLDEQDLLVSVCAGLVVLDTEDDTFRFVHYTTQEYFDRKRDILFTDAHAHIATSCLTYLGFAAFVPADSWLFGQEHWELDKHLEQYPLWHYVASKWADHARKTDDAAIVDASLTFLNRPSNINRAVQFNDRLQYVSYRLNQPLSFMNAVALFDLRNAMQRLLDKGFPADTRDSYGQTPLLVAAASGSLDVVTLLLARDDVNINALSNPPYSWTPLIMAVEGRHEPVIRALLNSGADVNLRSSRGTALQRAVIRHVMSAIELLLKAGANPNILDEEGSTVASYALEYDYTSGFEISSVLKLLQKYGANFKVEDKSRATLLHLASDAGNDVAVKMLLAEGLDPNAVDKDGRTPLDWCRLRMHDPRDSWYFTGRKKVAKLLHKYGAKSGRIQGTEDTQCLTEITDFSSSSSDLDSIFKEMTSWDSG